MDEEIISEPPLQHTSNIPAWTAPTALFTVPSTSTIPPVPGASENIPIDPRLLDTPLPVSAMLEPDESPVPAPVDLPGSSNTPLLTNSLSHYLLQTPLISKKSMEFFAMLWRNLRRMLTLLMPCSWLRRQAPMRLPMLSIRAYGSFFSQERLNLSRLLALHLSIISISRPWIKPKCLPICKFSAVFFIHTINLLHVTVERALVMGQHGQPGRQLFLGLSVTHRIGWRQLTATTLQQTWCRCL